MFNKHKIDKKKKFNFKNTTTLTREELGKCNVTNKAMTAENKGEKNQCIF